jgi:hypothetical protein
MRSVLLMFLLLPLATSAQEVLRSEFRDSVIIYRHPGKKNPYIILERELDRRKEQFSAQRIAFEESFAAEKTLVTDNYPNADFTKYEPEIKFYNRYLIKQKNKKAELLKNAKPLSASYSGCRVYIGESLDSLMGVVKIVEGLSGYHLFTVDDTADSTRINFSYSVVKEERGSKGNSLVNITASYNYEDKIINGDVVSVRTGMSSLNISAPKKIMCGIVAEFKKTIAACIVKEGDKFIYYGSDEKPYRALLYVNCNSDDLFGSLQLLSF